MPMRNRFLPLFVALGLIVMVLAAYLGYGLIDRYTPSKEQADISQVFQVQGDEIALFLNHQMAESKGFFLSGQAYLPITWVNRNLNDRFYWGAAERQLMYALPTEILYADLETKSQGNTPLIVEKDGEIYLSVGLVLNYTDIRVWAYDQGDIKRIYIQNTWEPQLVAPVGKAGAVRREGNIKSPILTKLVKGQKSLIVEKDGGWAKVLTQDGYLGYVETKYLGKDYEENLESTFEAPVYTRTALDEKVVLAWHQVTSLEANKGLEELIGKTKGLNVVAPTWFALSDNDGNFQSLASQSYVDQAHSLGLQVWALLDNFSKDVQSEILLSTRANREKLIEGLVKESLAYGIDGINLDFEGIKEEAGVHYVQFIRELSISCRESGLILSVDNYVPAPYNQFYNRKEQGIVADYVIVMGYDEHHAGGEAGSVASIGYVKQGITDSLAVVPKEKLINAIPLYTRVWTEKDGETSSSALGIKNARAWIEENQVELYWQDELGQYYGELNGNEGRKMIWMEEERSLGLKMDLIRTYDLAGVGCWKLGLEPEDIWGVIQP